MCRVPSPLIRQTPPTQIVSAMNKGNMRDDFDSNATIAHVHKIKYAPNLFYIRTSAQHPNPATGLRMSTSPILLIADPDEGVPRRRSPAATHTLEATHLVEVVINPLVEILRRCARYMVHFSWGSCRQRNASRWCGMETCFRSIDGFADDLDWV